MFLKFYKNQYSNQFLLFLHFPGLKDLIAIYVSYPHIWNKIQKFVWQHIGKNVFGRSMLVRQRPMKLLSSVCPSLSFLKIGSLVFSDIVHDDSWPWYLMTDRARFFKFGSLDFLEITYSFSWQQFLTSKI